jgi:protein O-mannosyl-transferase
MSDTSPELSVASKEPSAPAWWVYLLLAILSIGVYANSIVNSFALDDVAVIQENDNVRHLEWTAIWTSNYWNSDHSPAVDILYRPLTMWSYLANQAITPNNPSPFHGVNILLHALVTCMGMALTWRLFGSRAIAIVTGVLFAVHPIHTEVVANVVGRAELLAAAFSIAALLVFLPTEPLPRIDRLESRRWWHGWLVGMCFFAAILSKETPAALLLAFPTIDLWRWMRMRLEERPSLVRWVWGQTVRYYAPLGVMMGVYIVMRINGAGFMRDLHKIHELVNPLINATPAQRVVTPFALIAEYVKLVLWPKVLSADYSAPSLMPTANPFDSLPLAGILIVALLGIVMVREWKRRSPICLVIALLASSYALVANVLRIGTIFGERLFYWPSLFFFMLIAWVAVTAYTSVPAADRKFAYRWGAAAIAVLAVVAMSWRTIVRNTDWADNTTLAIATARDNPRSAKACFWAGVVLATNPDRKWSDVGEMLFKRAMEEYAGYPSSYWELAKLYARRNELGRSALYLAQAAEANSGDGVVRSALAGICDDFRKNSEMNYMPEIEAHLKQHPEDAYGYFARALVEIALSRDAAAMTDLKAALKRDRSFHEAAFQLGVLELKSGKEMDGIRLLDVYMSHVSSYDSNVAVAKALLEVDPVKFPVAVDDADRALRTAKELITVHPGMRALEETLRRRRAEQAAHAGEVANGAPHENSRAEVAP